MFGLQTNFNLLSGNDGGLLRMRGKISSPFWRCDLIICLAFSFNFHAARTSIPRGLLRS
jgi:hypothetical protein